jgi:hypothetical protein
MIAIITPPMKRTNKASATRCGGGAGSRANGDVIASA